LARFTFVIAAFVITAFVIGTALETRLALARKRTEAE